MDYLQQWHWTFFLQSEEVLSKFLKEKEDIGNMILQADQSLSKAEQEKEGTVQISCTLLYHLTIT